MLHYFEGHTADEAWRNSIQALLESGNARSQSSRLGPTREILHAMFAVQDARQRWVLSRKPPINPAFAIAEVVWILRGRRDSAFLNYWNPVLPKFAGDGETYHGAYGYRMRQHFGLDQVARAYQALRKNPDSRQVVLQIWDSAIDFPDNKGQPMAQDIPCNICAMPKIRDGKLEWFQVMRSNDLFLGTPHNFVQFMMLQEVLAGWLEVDVGSYFQVSDSMHCYEHDLLNFSISEAAVPVFSTDNLALPKRESDAAMTFIETAMDKFRQPRLSRQEFISELYNRDLPEGYRNLLTIVAADCARRRGWRSEVEAIVSDCTNPALSLAWRNWEERMFSREPPLNVGTGP